MTPVTLLEPRDLLTTLNQLISTAWKEGHTRVSQGAADLLKAVETVPRDESGVIAAARALKPILDATAVAFADTYRQKFALPDLIATVRELAQIHPEASS